MELFAADGHDAGGCERVTGKSGMRPPRVAVAMEHTHAELRDRAKQRHLFGRHLTGAEKRHRLGPVACLNRLETLDQRT